MKRFLPKSIKNLQGFTLIELMIVVTIIGILALVSVGVYNGAQGNARDGRRVVEVNALAKNIESTRDPSTGKYSYTAAKFTADYPKGLLDPADSSTYYCVAFANSTADIPNPITPPDTNPTNTTGTFNCPVATAAIAASAGLAAGVGTAYVKVQSTTTNPVGVADMAAQGPTSHFSVCAVRSERGSKPFCQSQFLK